MNDIKLAKLQYLSERTAILELGSPIIDDAGVSLEHGPCLSATLSLTNDRSANPLWDEHIAFESHLVAREAENTVVLRSPVEVGRYLSPAEIRVLQQIWEQFGASPKWSLKKWCHDHLKEYSEVPSGGRAPITLEALLMAGGHSEAEAARVAEEIRYHERMDAEFGQPGAASA